NCSGIQSFLFGVILQTAEIVVQYAFWQFLTPVSSSFVRNPGKAGQNRWEVYYKKFVTYQQAESKKSQSSRSSQMKKFQEELEQQRQQAMSMYGNTV
nr:hypothetical protein [Goleter apudmare HA4340-LM2]